MVVECHKTISALLSAAGRPPARKKNGLRGTHRGSDHHLTPRRPGSAAALSVCMRAPDGHMCALARWHACPFVVGPADMKNRPATEGAAGGVLRLSSRPIEMRTVASSAE
ncbi:hypothetical protein MTO96_020352 [Rhipicephalus appendiculatus]